VTVSRATASGNVVGIWERVSAVTSASPPAMRTNSPAIRTAGVAAQGSRRRIQISATMQTTMPPIE